MPSIGWLYCDWYLEGWRKHVHTVNEVLYCKPPTTLSNYQLCHLRSGRIRTPILEVGGEYLSPVVQGDIILSRNIQYSITPSYFLEL